MEMTWMETFQLLGLDLLALLLVVLVVLHFAEQTAHSVWTARSRKPSGRGRSVAERRDAFLDSFP